MPSPGTSALLQLISATLTIRAAEEIAAEPPRTMPVKAVRIVSIAAVVVVAAARGAPLGWVLAGAAFPVAYFALALYESSQPIRERARRAAAVNRARLAAPECVAARVGGVGA